MKKRFDKIIIAGVGLIILILVIYLEPFEMSSPKSEINVAHNSYSWAVDYVTPSAVSGQTHSILGSRYNGILTERDVRDLQEWVGNNIEYKLEEPEYPTETLEDEDGNCFNMCNLLLSMILNEDENADSYMLLLDLLFEGSSEVSKHCAVLSIFDDGVIISDPTLGSVVNNFCILSDPEDALDVLIEGTTVEWYIPTNAINLNGSNEFSNREEFVSFVEGVQQK